MLVVLILRKSSDGVEGSRFLFIGVDMFEGTTAAENDIPSAVDFFLSETVCLAT